MKKKIIGSFIFLIVLLLLFGKDFTNLDNDFFHIAVSGREMWESKSFIYENVHFVSEGFGTIIQQWLYCIMVYASYLASGYSGVAIFTCLQFLLLSYVMYKVLRLYKVNSFLSCSIIILSHFIMGYINIRPQMISLVLLYLQIYIVEKYRQDKKVKILYLLPLLTLLQINLHSTFWIFHYLFLLASFVWTKQKYNKIRFSGLDGIEDNSLRIKPFIVPMLLMFLSLFINPYGYKNVFLLFTTFGGLSCLNIIEMQPLSFVSAYMLVLILFVVIFVYAYKKKCLKSETFNMALGTTVLFCLATRNLMFLSVGLFLVLKDIALKQKKLDFSKVKFNKKEWLGIILVICFCSVLMLPNSTKKEITKDTANTPKLAVRYIKEHETNLDEIKIFTTFGSGAYFVWEQTGKNFFEPKTEPAFKYVNQKENLVREYCSVKQTSSQELQDFVNKYDFDYLFVTPDLAALNVWLEMSADYKCVVVSKELTKDYELPVYKLYKKVKQ